MTSELEQEPAAVSLQTLHSPVYGYLPETGLTEPKHGRGCRLFREECALVHASGDLRVVASRGRRRSGGLSTGESLLSLPGLTEEVCEQIRSFCTDPRDGRLLLAIPNGSLVLFSHLLEAAELLTVLRFEASDKEVARALRRMDAYGGEELLFTDREESASLSVRQIGEALFETERLLEGYSKEPLRLFCARAAGFAGCRLSPVERSSTAPVLSSSDRRLLAAMLIGSFLILRELPGRVGTALGEGTVHREAPEFLLRILQGIPTSHTDALPAFADEKRDSERALPEALEHLLALPAFRRFHASVWDGSVVIEMTFSRPTTGLRSGVGPGSGSLRLVLSGIC